MQTKHLFVLIHIRNKGEVGITKLVKPSSIFLLTVPRGAFLWILFIIYVSCLSYCLVCSFKPCGHLLEEGYSLGCLVCGVFLCFVTFPCD